MRSQATFFSGNSDGQSVINDEHVLETIERESGVPPLMVRQSSAKFSAQIPGGNRQYPNGSLFQVRLTH